MPDVPTDEMIEFALEELLSGNDPRRRALVRNLCMRWPGVPALVVAFVLTSAAAMIEDNFDRHRDPAAVAALAYRLAALLAADIYAVESMGFVPAKAQDLLHFWRRVDPYFLNL
jgi:hypothetical protein